MKTASYYRDAARLAREQAKIAGQRSQGERAWFWKRQASIFESDADHAESISDAERVKDEVILLFLREAVTQGWEAGFLIGPESWESSIIIQHPFCGPLGWSMMKIQVPEWVPVYSGPPVDIDDNEMYDRIDRYLRAKI